MYLCADKVSERQFFVSEVAASAGVTVTNRSSVQDLIILKHFGPGNRSLPASIM